MKYKIGTVLQQAVCVCLFITAAAFFMKSDMDYKRTSEKVVAFTEDNLESVYLRVSDVYGKEHQKSLSEFFQEDGALERMKQFNHMMHDQYKFLEFDIQSVVMLEDFPYKEEFRADYGSADDMADDGTNKVLKSCQMDQNAYDFFHLNDYLVKGNGFSSSSFTYTGQETVDVLLGYEYTDLIDIGDILHVEYLTEEMDLKVSGFLGKDSAVAINNNVYFLDRLMILPFVNISDAADSMANQDFPYILYSLKNWGYIKVKDGDNFYDYKNSVDEISKSLDLKYVLNEGYVSPYIANTANTLSSAKGFYLISSIAVFLIIAIIILLISVWDYKRKKSDYAVLLICGCSLGKLKRKIFLRITLQLLVSVISASVINKSLLGYHSLYAYDRQLFSQAVSKTGLISLLAGGVIFMILNLYINKSNIYDSLRKGSGIRE